MSRTRARDLLAWFVLWLIGLPAGAVEPVPEWRYESWNRADGLPVGGVSAICRSRDGYLWLGGADGLRRFNGLRFEPVLLPTNAQDNQPAVFAIHEDAAATLWVGTDSGLMRRRAEKFEVVAPERLASREITAVVSDRQERLWLGTSRGVVVIAEDSVLQPAGYDRPVTAIVEDARGTIWVAGYGLLQSDGSELRAVKLSSSGAEPVVTSLASTSDGRLWLATEVGLLQFTPGPGANDGVVLPVAARDAAHRGVPIRRVAEIGGERIVVGGENGVLYEQVDGVLLPVLRNTPVEVEPIRALHADLTGAVWIGTQRMLALTQRSSFVGLGPEQGFPARAATAIRADHVGRLWIGTRGAGVMIFDGHQLQPAPQSARLPGQIVAALETARDGSVYVATRPAGLARIDDRGVEDLTQRFKLERDRVRAIHQTRDGAIWLATMDRGVVKIVGDRLESRPELALLADEYVSQIATAPDGALWFVGDESLVRLEGTRAQRFGRESGFAATTAISITPDGPDWWVATEGAGMMLFRDSRFTDLRPFAPTMMSDVENIALDSRGFLWLSGRNGLQRIARDQLAESVAEKRSRVEVRSFGMADGLPTNDLSSYSAHGSTTDQAGRVWFTARQGVIGYQFEAPDQPKQTISLRIDRVEFADQLWLGAGALQIPARTPHVEFRFAALNFEPNESLHYRYRLEGVDADWVDAGTEPSATYNYLPGGRHQLTVEVLDDSGRWERASSSLEFDVEKRLSESGWFHPALVVACGLLALLLHRWRARALRRRAALLEGEVRDRTMLLSQARDQLELRVQQRTEELTRELTRRSQLEEQLVQARTLERIGRLAGGMAHDLNNILTAILGFAELADSRSDDREVRQHLAHIRSSGERAALLTQRLLGFARQQLVRPEQIDVGERLGQIRPSLEELCQGRAELRIDVPARPISIRIDPRQFESLIFELVSNARDALDRPGVIEVDVRGVTLDSSDAELQPGDYAELQVRDSGTGISDEAREHLFEPFYTTKEIGTGAGLGLASVFGIVKQNRGAIRVESSAQRGTCVRLLIPRSEGQVQSVPRSSAS